MEQTRQRCSERVAVFCDHAPGHRGRVRALTSGCCMAASRQDSETPAQYLGTRTDATSAHLLANRLRRTILQSPTAERRRSDGDAAHRRDTQWRKVSAV